MKQGGRISFFGVFEHTVAGQGGGERREPVAQFVAAHRIRREGPALAFHPGKAIIRARVQDFLARLRGWLTNALATGLSPVALDLSLGGGPAPAVSQALLYQYARNGIELQSSLFPWELELCEPEPEDY
jgi:hypothetical protein